MPSERGSGDSGGRLRRALRGWLSGHEPLWTPAACGILALLGWLGPRLWAASGVGAVLPAPFSTLAFSAEAFSTAAFAGSYLFGGLASLVRSVEALRRRRLDVDLLMLLSAGGAASIGEWLEGAALLFLFSLSNALEERALARTTRAIEALMELRPDEAQLLPGGVGGEEERTVAVESLVPGQVVRVRPGERLPVDGRVASGRTGIDQAAVTGESLPVEKGPGDGVFAGTINVGGTVDVEVERPAAESFLARIIRRVEEARESKAPTQHWVDRFEQRYAAAVILGAATAALLPLAFGAAFQPTFYRAMTLLVVASPCALVISTPASLLSALAHAARRGLLFKGGAPLEAMAGVDAAAFDKTGTLTRGVPAVTAVVPYPGTSEVELLARAAAAEHLSEHHLGRAVVDAARARNLEIPVASDLVNVQGRGIHARVGEVEVTIGRRDFVEEAVSAGGAADLGAASERLRALGDAGATIVYVGWPGGGGGFAVEDTLRPEAAESLAALREIGVRELVLLTGDHEGVARKVAEELGIDHYRAGLMPEDKVTALAELRERGLTVLMAGDGVNDAPALATAAVGVAMGAAGTDAALETADLVLVRDDLRGLAYAVALARRTRRIILQNLIFAGTVIAVLVGITLFRGLPLPLGVLGHEGSTLVVIANGLRLLRGVPEGKTKSRPYAASRSAR